MRYRKLSPTGDYVFGNGQDDFYVNVPETIGQLVKTGLLLWLGEWFLDSSLGTPYMQGILGKYSQAQADTTIQNQALNTFGVVDVTNYVSVLDPVTRAESISFNIDTIYGPTPVQIQNYLIY